MPPQVPCHFFRTARGCRAGDRCRFVHETPVIATPETTGEPRERNATQLELLPPQNNEGDKDEFGPLNTIEPYILHNRLSHKLGLQTLQNEALAKNPRATLHQVMPPIHKKMFKRIKEYAESTSDPVGWHLLATYYQSGFHGPRDPQKAIEWFRRAADAECVGAMHDLALCYNTGAGVLENQSTAFGWFKKAAEGGYHQSQLYVGLRYLQGNGVGVDMEAAVEWIKKARDGGNEQAGEFLSMYSDDDDDSDEDEDEEDDEVGSKDDSNGGSESEVDLVLRLMGLANSEGLSDGVMRMQAVMEKLDFGSIAQFHHENPHLSREDILQSRLAQQMQILADEGDPFGLHQMSVFYSNGSAGITKDPKKAFELNKEASEKGYLAATHDLALCYLNGEGVQKNSKRSVELLTIAAEGGFVISQLSLANRLLAGEGYLNAIFTLGKCHWNGHGTSQDYNLGVQYFKDAASKGDSESSFYLGLAYENGLGGCKKDAERAYQSFLACAEGEPNKATQNAMYNLGVLCFNKVTSTGRKSDATGWFEEAGTPPALYVLGFMYRLGNGVRKNGNLSQQYFMRAFMNGYMPAAVALSNTRARMPALGTLACCCNAICGH
ncbi:hypothetical protein BDR26DRAFT_923536 [Obelidium mucronatum]|nr:hypothetical protein BDR26DRAFT_923536 [Obelidium mucronatum]